MNWMNGFGQGAGTLVVLTALALLGVAGALAALAFLEGQAGARKWCLCYWALQIPTFACSWLSYRFLAGGDLRVGVRLSHPGLFYDFQLGYGFIASITQEGPAAYIGANVLAIAAALFFRRASPSQISA
jgi:hypothetical protein